MKAKAANKPKQPAANPAPIKKDPKTMSLAEQLQE